MPLGSSDADLTPQQHLRGGDDNLAFADTLSRGEDGSPLVVGWAITVLFYAAVHYVRGYLLARHEERVTSHEEMRPLVKKYPELRQTLTDYNELKQYSQSARYYLSRGFTWDDYATLKRRANRIGSVWKPKIERLITSRS